MRFYKNKYKSKNSKFDWLSIKDLKMVTTEPGQEKWWTPKLKSEARSELRYRLKHKTKPKSRKHRTFGIDFPSI